MLKCSSILVAILFLWPAQAAPIQEVFFHSGIVTESLVKTWSSTGGSRDFVLDLGYPYPADLENLVDLKGARSLTLEFERFPSEDTEPVLKKLASLGAEFVALGAGIPNEDEIGRLNRIGFRRTTLVMTGVPDEGEGARLKHLAGEVSVTFAVRSYPKYDERDALLAIPSSIPLLFITDYWPWYAHMDVFNMIPHRIRLRVSDIFPDESALPYLNNIKRLESIQVRTDGDAPYATEWNKFGTRPLGWIASDWVPTQAGLSAFAGDASLAANRSLTVDRDGDLTQDERRRLENAPVRVRWIHAAPMGPGIRNPWTLGRRIVRHLGMGE